jgi:hypothetical protein
MYKELESAKAIAEYYKSLYEAIRMAQPIKTNVEHALLMENYNLHSIIKGLYLKIARLSLISSEDVVIRKDAKIKELKELIKDNEHLVKDSKYKLEKVLEILEKCEENYEQQVSSIRSEKGRILWNQINVSKLLPYLKGRIFSMKSIIKRTHFYKRYKK